MPGETKILTLNISTKETKTEEQQKPVKRLITFIVFCILASGIGAITGAVDALFGIVLLELTDIRDGNPIWFIPFLAAAGIVIYFIYDRFGKETQNGMSLLFDRARNKRSEIKLRLIPFVTLSTWMTHLFGGSAGREGVAVQIGGTIGSFVARNVRLGNKNSVRVLTITGMAAGFGGLFRTPIAAVFFATEVLSAGHLDVTALLPALIASYTAGTVSGYLGLEKFSVVSDIEFHITLQTFFPFCIAAVSFGIIGGCFALLLRLAKKLVSRLITNPYIRIAFAGAVISILSLLLYCGRYSGLGTNLISACFNGGEVYYWDFILKFVLTILTISAGFQGGEVTPLFAIGATLGAIIASLTGMPVILFAALGYAAVFGAATNTLIAPMFIGAEVFGFQYMPFFFAACVIAYIFNGNNSIYTKQHGSNMNHTILQLKK